MKRTDPKSIYHATDSLRTARLSQRLQEQSKGKRVGREDEEKEGTKEAEEGMEVEGEAGGEAEAGKEVPAKVSTSGHRMSGREIWKSSKRGKVIAI